MQFNITAKYSSLIVSAGDFIVYHLNLRSWDMMTLHKKCIAHGAKCYEGLCVESDIILNISYI